MTDQHLLNCPSRYQREGPEPCPWCRQIRFEDAMKDKYNKLRETINILQQNFDAHTHSGGADY